MRVSFKYIGATLDRLESSNVAPLDALLELSNWGEGANVHGCRQEEKGRIGRQTNRSFQKGSFGFGNLTGSPGKISI